MGVCTFSRHFRETLGRAPHAFVIDRRVERAKPLLSLGDLAVKEVASSCDFADQAHLTRVFRCRAGHHACPAAPRVSGLRFTSGARALRATGCGHRAHCLFNELPGSFKRKRQADAV
jgi:AraC-like DNA-binding protein